MPTQRSAVSYSADMQPWIDAAHRHVRMCYEQAFCTPTVETAKEFVEAFVHCFEMLLSDDQSRAEEMPEKMCLWAVAALSRKDHAWDQAMLHALLATLAEHSLYEWRLYMQQIEHGTSQSIAWCLAHLPYDQYLETRHWQSLRDTIMQLSGGRCQVCNGTEWAQVHHRTYIRRGCERLTDLIEILFWRLLPLGSRGKKSWPTANSCLLR